MRIINKRVEIYALQLIDADKIKRIMDVLSLFLLIQQQRSIKFLREEQNLEDWTKIAQILNNNIKGEVKTAKECRSRYLSRARFLKDDENLSEVQQWTIKQDNLLLHFYLQQGYKWNNISYNFPNRSEIFIKNRFYSALRKAARKMNEIQSRAHRPQRNPLKDSMFLNIFDISTSVGSRYPEIYQKIDKRVRMTQLKMSILNYAFRVEEMSESQVYQMVKKIRKLNGKIRSFGLFKLKNRKNLKITEEAVHLLENLLENFDSASIKEDNTQ